MGQKQNRAVKNHRAYDRHPFEMAVEYVVKGTSAPVRATLFNLGAGGMYFETGTPLPAGTHLYIRLLDYSPDVHGDHETYHGKVAWSGERQRDAERRYGVGVRFLNRDVPGPGTGKRAGGTRFRRN